MKILITNDDGIKSTGIVAARNAVKNLADTTVVAPMTQQSGVGHAITLIKPLRLFKKSLYDNSEGYAVTGTPTDCVVLGSLEIMDEKPDLLISGINLGENLSKTITTSGTLGAAFEAAELGIPAIAVSLQMRHEEMKFIDGVYDIDWEHSEKILSRVVKKVIDNGMPDGVSILNLNIPLNMESDEIIQTKFADTMYTKEVDSVTDPYGMKLYWIVGEEVNDAEEKTDVHTIRKLNQPSITPITKNLFDDVDISKWLK